MLGRLVWRVRDDAEGMDAAAHQRRDRRIDHPVPLELRSPGEGRGHEPHPVVTALLCPGMARVAGAVVEHLEGKGRERLLEGGADLAGGGCARKRLLALKGRV
jgi:hypothetical protein